MAISLLEFLYEEAERRNRKYEENCPRCYNCDEPIYDDYAYEIDGNLYCEECIESFRVPVEVD